MEKQYAVYKIKIKHKVKSNINLLTIFQEQLEIAHVLQISRYHLICHSSL